MKLKITLTALLLILLNSLCLGQNDSLDKKNSTALNNEPITNAISSGIEASFIKTKEIVSCKVGELFESTIVVRVPAQKAFFGFKVFPVISKSDYGLDESKIYLAPSSEIVIDSSLLIEKTYTIAFTPLNENLLTIRFLLKAIDTSGKTIEINSIEKEFNLYIQPKNTEISNKSKYEFWLFTGTNLDLIDGPKLKDPYIKGSYLLNFKNNVDTNTFKKGFLDAQHKWNRRLLNQTLRIEALDSGNDKRTKKLESLARKKRRWIVDSLHWKQELLTASTFGVSQRSDWWMFIRFGQNRYLSDSISNSNLVYTNFLERSYPDSVDLEYGQYSNTALRTTNSTFLRLDIMREVLKWSKDSSRSFLLGGINVRRQVVRTSYGTSNNISIDTLRRGISIGDTIRTKPIPIDQDIKSFYLSPTIGLMHVLSLDRVNIKTQLAVGYEIAIMPTFIRETSEGRIERFARVAEPTLRFNIDATVLKPAVSFGFEMYWRNYTVPMFNISISKVFDVEKINQLFKGGIAAVDF